MISIYGRSHVGRRKNNEDRFVADSNWGLAMIADGMGGPEAGEIAATIATNKITDFIDSGQSLQAAIYCANNEIIAAAEDGRGKPGMGTTLSLIHI